MKPIAMSSDLRKLIYSRYCPVVARILSISTPFTYSELPPGDKAVAYTILDGSRKTQIFINPYHPMFSADPDPVRQACAFCGVLIHEMLHKKYTEPIYYQELAQKEQVRNSNLFHAISNIIEDFTIESRAIADLDISDATLRMIEKTTGVSFASKKPLTALDTAIITSWTQSRPVNPSDPVCGQVLDALIDFTDLGPLVPGSSLSAEAADLYRTVTPIIYEAIWKPPFERARTALDVYRAMEPYLDGKDQLLADRADGGTSGQNREASQEAADPETRAAVEGSDAMKAKARIVRQLVLQSRKAQSEQATSENLTRGTASESAPDANASTAGDSEDSAVRQQNQTAAHTGDERKKSGKNGSDAESNASAPDPSADSGDPESEYDSNTEGQDDSDDSPDGEAPDGEDSSESPEYDECEEDDAENGDDTDDTSDREGPDNEESPALPECDDFDETHTESEDDTDASPNDEVQGEGTDSAALGEDDSGESGSESVTENGDDTDDSSNEEGPDSGDVSGSDSSAENAPGEENRESPELPPDAFTADPETERRIRSLQSDISSETFDVSDLESGSICQGADFSQQDSQVIDYSLEENVESDYFNGKTVKCLNYRVDGVSRSTYEQYERIKKKNAAEIARFSRRMRNLVTDSESTSFEKNGRLSMKRYAEKGNSTINLFSRRTQKDRQNSRVLICLDVSGSMQGNKIAKAGEALVCLVEGLTSAGIPVKVITFCENLDTVIHHHYVNYGSSRLDRASLMLIQPGGRNFDGFSIRFAVKDLMKKRVSHDILIIISDGQPNTSYVGYKDMLADTAAAVMEAKRLTRVIGIGIDANIDTLRGFYKDTFVEMTDIENLMKNLTRLIEKEVRAW